MATRHNRKSHPFRCAQCDRLTALLNHGNVSEVGVAELAAEINQCIDRDVARNLANRRAGRPECGNTLCDSPACN